MRQITEVLRLNAQGLSYRQIAQSVGISASTVQSYLERAQRAGLSWPLPDDVDEAELMNSILMPWYTARCHRRDLRCSGFGRRSIATSSSSHASHISAW